MAIEYYPVANTHHVRTDICSACGAARGWDFEQFADHLASHAPEDFGLTPMLAADGGLLEGEEVRSE